MKKLRATFIIMTALLIAGLIAGCASGNKDTTSDTSEKEESVAANGLFANISTTDINGNPITSELFAENELTLVNIWASFCRPCITEIPILEELYQEYNGKGVGIAGLLIDTSTPSLSAGLSDAEREKGLKVINDTGATYPQLTLSEEMLETELKEINAFPTSYFVDKDGNVVGTLILGAKDKNSWKREIESHLKTVLSEE